MANIKTNFAQKNAGAKKDTRKQKGFNLTNDKQK